MPEAIRVPEHPIAPLFLERWSPRAFTGEVLQPADLLPILEAARWAPSAYNAQPWRFVYALAGTPAWASIFSTLVPFNQSWAERAGALVAIASSTRMQAPGVAESSPNPSHSFDSGAAWACMALQASLSGWHAHGVAGFDKQKLRENLAIPETFSVEAIAVIGRRSEDLSTLQPALRSREVPSTRMPLRAIAAEGRFEADGR